MIRKDTPILNVADDLLNRDNFVESLKQSIINYSDNDESLTIGLYGKWGEGKTSVINLLKKNWTNKKILFVLHLNLGFIQIQNN
jgi:predicted KAP-like P-loop ATPase